MTLRWTLMLLLFVSVVPTFAAETAPPPNGSDGFISLEMPVVELQKLGERCPVRVEMPLPELKIGDKPRIVGVVARYVSCRGVRISQIEVSARKTQFQGVELVVGAHVIAPGGQDTSARLHYRFVTSGGDEYPTDQYLPLDEGEVNWGNPTLATVPEATDISTLRLKVEMEVPNR